MSLALASITPSIKIAFRLRLIVVKYIAKLQHIQDVAPKESQNNAR